MSIPETHVPQSLALPLSYRGMYAPAEARANYLILTEI